VNKEELIQFYSHRIDFLEDFDNGSIDFGSIDRTNIHDQYINIKSNNPIMIIGNFPKYNDKSIFPQSSMKFIKDNINCDDIDLKKDVVFTNSFPFITTETSIGNRIINRAPTQLEALAGSIMLIREIELIKPKMIIALGSSALISLKYSNDEQFIKSLDDLSLNFLLDTYIDVLDEHVIIGYTHYPSSMNIKSVAKQHELIKFFDNVKKTISKGYETYLDSLTKKDLISFGFNDFAQTVIDEIKKDGLYITPQNYKDYFFKLLKYQDEETKQEVKRVLLDEN
jgi:hypothetical protein